MNVIHIRVYPAIGKLAVTSKVSHAQNTNRRIPMYGCLSNVQVMAGVTANEGVSSADSELTMYLGKACNFINDALKGFAPEGEVAGATIESWKNCSIPTILLYD